MVGGNFGEEVRFGGEDLSVKEFGFDGAVNAFDIGIGVGAGGGIEAVFGLEVLLEGEVEAADSIITGIAIELRTQVGGEGDGGGVQAMIFEVLEEALDGEGGIGFGEFVAVGQELSAAGELADGVLEAGQAIGLHLGPVEGNIGEVFDIHLEAGERGISGFDGAEIVFAFVFAFWFTCKLVLAQDAIESVVADFKAELSDQPASAKAGSFCAMSQDFGFQGGGSFVGTGSRGAGFGQEAFIMLVLKAAQPFADGIAGTVKATGGGFEAVSQGISDQIVAEGEFRIAGTDHGVIGLVCGQRSLGLV